MFVDLCRCLTITGRQDMVKDYLHEIVDELIKEINISLPSLSKGKNNLNGELLDICKKSMVVSNEYIRKLFERFIEQNLTKKVKLFIDIYL